MSTLGDILRKSVSLGDLQRIKGLGVIPILAQEVRTLPELTTLESALKRRAARITETSLTGEVPFLLLKNTGDLPIIILDGEEVIGGKQNRIINTTLVVLAKTSVKIPVSCIQAGRWRHDRAYFTSAGSVFRARSRAIHMTTVTHNVVDNGSFRSDQRAVWDEVAASLGELGVSSSTSNFMEGRERVANRVEEFVEASRLEENQVGAIFLDSEGILGLEIPGAPALFSKVSDKVARSFAFEVINSPDLDGVSIEAATQWWASVLATKVTGHDSPGAGVDIRIRSDDLIGSGLIWNRVVVHLSCFPNLRGRSQRRD